MSFNAKPGPNISNSDWSTHSWNKGGISGNYQDYRDLIGADIFSGYGDDNIFSRDELNAITNTKYDIRGDGRAPHTGNYFDQGAATQDAIARLITTKGITTTDDILQQYGLRQDQATGDIISSAGFNHSAFGAGAGNDATWEGYGSKADFGGSHYSYGDFEDGKIPTWRYKYQGNWTPPSTDPPVPCGDGEIRNSDGVCEPVMSTLPGGDPTDTKEHADNQKEYIDFTYKIPQPDNSGKKRGWDDPDLKAAFLADFMTPGNTNADGSYKYVTPGRQLGIDLTPAEQMGSIPYVSANQYMSNFINAPKLGTASSLASSLKDLDQLDRETAARGGSVLS